MNASSATPSSLTHAINLLTNPLTSSQSNTTIISLRFILQANLIAPFSNGRSIDIHLKLDPMILPPAPILASCIASGITWAEWSRSLGGRPFELFVSSSTVHVKLDFNSKPILVWSQEEDCSVVPISKLQQKPKGTLARLVKTRNAAIVIRVPKLLPARPSIETRNSFSSLRHEVDLSSDSSSEESSRPSSRQSDYSFVSSDDDSLTSVSSVESSPILATKRCAINGAFANPMTRRSEPVVDSDKKSVTSYLYQGGLTRVMTGGVMLGARATANLKSKPAAPAVASTTKWRRSMLKRA